MSATSTRVLLIFAAISAAVAIASLATWFGLLPLLLIPAALGGRPWPRLRTSVTLVFLLLLSLATVPLSLYSIVHGRCSEPYLLATAICIAWLLVGPLLVLCDLNLIIHLVRGWPNTPAVQEQK